MKSDTSTYALLDRLKSQNDSSNVDPFTILK